MVNLREIKLQMEKQVGLAPTRQYFSYLNGFLSRKLTKPEFDKLCILTLGQDNLFLHNQLIRSVFQNACQYRVGRPDPSLEPVTPICSNESDLNNFVKRQRVEENTVPVPVSIRKVGSSRSFCETDFLLSNEELKRRLDDIARENGLEGGATSECAELLNTGLDLYLRRVIRSCLDQINGTRNGTISIHDFRIAMEMNPQQLGRDWPLLLEKLSCLWFEAKD